MAVVKADGFGAGMVDVARTSLDNGATWLGVTSLEEAAVLRDAGLDAPVLSWLHGLDADFRWAVRHDIDLAVPSLAHLGVVIRAVGTAGRRRRARIHLYVDCGLARDGAPYDEWAALCAAARAAEIDGLVHVTGVMGHLALADQPDHPENSTARRTFLRAIAVARAHALEPEHRHLAATAATLHDPASHHTMSRIGVGLVGIDPSGRCYLRGALSLHTSLLTVRPVKAGTAVGYGHTWAAPQATRLGLIPVGFADGLPRAASPGAEVLVNGRRCPLVGRISMDQSVVDLGPEGASPGDPVLVFGYGEPTVTDWAHWAGTIPHEIVTGIGSRVRRHVVADQTRRAS